MSYKSCAVPACTNTTIKTPEKLFITMTKNLKFVKSCCDLHTDPKEIKERTVIFSCQDHFDIETNTANYYQCNMGLSHRVILLYGVVPTKFYCQEDRRKRMSNASTSRLVFVK